MTTQKDILWLILGAAVFGILMGLRPELPNHWLRSFVAGIAFVVLGTTIYRMKPKKQA